MSLGRRRRDAAVLLTGAGARVLPIDASRVCRACGAVAPPGSVYCENCGSALRADVEAPVPEVSAPSPRTPARRRLALAVALLYLLASAAAVVALALLWRGEAADRRDAERSLAAARGEIDRLEEARAGLEREKAAFVLRIEGADK